MDVSEGKTDQIYRAHSYHTKVPHLAIVPSILHYTEPGDVVLDGFCGSGMTGVAAQWCGTAKKEYRREIEARFEKQGQPKPVWGARRAVLNDLSPAATFIAANYNLPFDVQEFARAGKSILDEVEHEIGWMYHTLHVEPASSRPEVLHVEPASSRLSASVGFEPCDPFQAPAVTFHKDNLPHIQVAGATYFITFRTENLRILSPEARSIALNAVLHWDRKRWTVMSVVVMPDHVHLIAKPLPKGNLRDADSTSTTWLLAEILHSIKSFSSNEINKLEGKRGVPVWQTESYDRIIRDERELVYELAYMNHNPVKAGLTARAEDYQWRYVSPEMQKAGWKPAPLGRIEYTVWSEVFSCPDCTGEVVFLEEALDKETKRVRDAFPCPHCNCELSKKRLDRNYEARFDRVLGKTVQTPKRRPSLISYKVGKQRYEKKPDQFDLALLEKIAAMEWPAEVPYVEIPGMHMTHERARMDRQGITHIHHFFLPRAAHSLAALWRKANSYPNARIRHMLLFFVEQAIVEISVLNRFRPTGYSQVKQYLTGVYYVAAQHAECSPWYILDGKLSRLNKAFQIDVAEKEHALLTTGTAAWLGLPDACVDYIFTDPPFGENIYYADLNFLVESWHRVITNAEPEAIIDKFKKKGLAEYQHLMQRCFEEYCRVLKPGRWMTVVFHNSRNAVWNAIQEGLQAAGFVVADVRTLDKQQGSYRQVTSTAVKQDLVISAYKPNDGLEDRFNLTAGTEEGVWDFIRTHLKQLPVFVSKDGRAEVIAERQNYLLFDRMVAFHVQRGVTVPMSAAEFYAGLEQRFPPRDGMYFLPDQTAEYDKKRMTVKEVLQLQLFVSDEASAIQWLKQQLTRKPQTFQDIHPQFMKEIGGWQKHEKPLELSELLEQNFLRYDGKGPIPAQIVSWIKQSADLRKIIQEELSTGRSTEENGQLETRNQELITHAKARWYVPDPNKAGDLEKLRERSLLKEFKEYRESKQKRLKVFRLEAVRAGFKKAWQERDYATIIAVARKIPDKILQEDPKLLMWYDQAVTRTGE